MNQKSKSALKKPLKSHAESAFNINLSLNSQLPHTMDSPVQIKVVASVVIQQRTVSQLFCYCTRCLDVRIRLVQVLQH